MKTGEIPKNILKFLREVISGIIQAIKNPGGDPVQTALALGVVLLGLLTILTLGYIIYSLFRPTMQREVLVQFEEIEPELTPRERWISWGILAGLIIIIVGSASYYVSAPSFCSQCHVVRKEFKSWQASSHAGVHCLACHQQPGVYGFLTQKTRYLRETLLFLTNNYDVPFRAFVTNESCLQCHNEITKKVVTKNTIRVRHQDFLKNGARCTDCHNTVAHEDVVPIQKKPSMNECVSCHNNQKVSADCDLCHTTEIPKPRNDFVKVEITMKRSCRGCHSAIDPCATKCHGVELPHSQAWVKQGAHARIALLNKYLCWRCHPGNPESSEKPYGFCNKCHGFPPPYHDMGTEWIKWHIRIASTPYLELVQGEEGDCQVCHTRTTEEELCNLCHPGKGYKLKAHR